MKHLQYKHSVKHLFLIYVLNLRTIKEIAIMKALLIMECIVIRKYSTDANVRPALLQANFKRNNSSISMIC